MFFAHFLYTHHLQQLQFESHCCSSCVHASTYTFTVLNIVYHMVSVAPFQSHYCCCAGSSRSEDGSTAARRAGCRSYALNPNTAASPSCSPVSCNYHTDPSAPRQRKTRAHSAHSKRLRLIQCTVQWDTCILTP